jgi:hypothetical protein
MGHSARRPSFHAIHVSASTRFGAALGVGEDRQNRITIDAGAWYGKVNPADDEPKTFLIPMGGVGFYW